VKLNNSVIAFASLVSHRKLTRQQWDKTWTASYIRDKSTGCRSIYKQKHSIIL